MVAVAVAVAVAIPTTHSLLLDLSLANESVEIRVVFPEYHLDLYQNRTVTTLLSLPRLSRYFVPIHFAVLWLGRGVSTNTLCWQLKQAAMFGVSYSSN